MHHVGTCATGGGMCGRWGCVPGRGEVGVHENMLILVRSMYLSEYI